MDLDGGSWGTAVNDLRQSVLILNIKDLGMLLLVVEDGNHGKGHIRIFQLQVSFLTTSSTAQQKLSCLLKEQLLEPALNLTVHCCSLEFRVLNGYDQKSFDEERGLN
ncbi:hypothetical protein Tco_1163166 [Tanacetum coccineum]